MSHTPPALTLGDPVFATYAIAAALMVLKAVSMAWLTVLRMMQVGGGYRAPEDLRKTALNPSPSEAQLAPDERVERFRRILQNDLENLPFFLAAGFLFLFTNPSLLLAQVLYYGYVLSRLAHFAAYASAQNHEVRAACWTVGSLIIVWFAVRTIAAAAFGI